MPVEFILAQSGRFALELANSTLESAQLGGELGLPLPPPPPMPRDNEAADLADWWDGALVPTGEGLSNGWVELWEELVLEDEIEGSE